MAESKFKEWNATADLSPHMMFSKRIARWVEDKYNPNFSGKPDILFSACCNAPIEEITTESISRLIETIKKAVAESVQPFANPIEHAPAASKSGAAQLGQSK